MGTKHTGGSRSRRARQRHTGPLLPAVLGVCSAVLLGGAGFGLGCLYGQVAVPGPVAATEPMGGPDEAAPEAASSEESGSQQLAALAVVPARFAVLQSGQALAMSRPVVGGWVSSHFGQRPDPFTGQPALHQGLDFAGLDNSAIFAAAPGVVTRSGRRSGYGNFIEIDHGNGWVTRYGHNASNLVTPGDYVKPGQTIALMGSTGRATGTHLHFEVLHRGRHQNPARFVPRDA